MHGTGRGGAGRRDGSDHSTGNAVLEALSEELATESLLYLLSRGTTFKHHLKDVTKSWRRVNRLVQAFERGGLVLVEDISTGNKRLYRVSLTERGGGLRKTSGSSRSAGTVTSWTLTG